MARHDPHLAGRVVSHPANRGSAAVVTRLLAQLDACQSAADLCDMQEALYEASERAQHVSDDLRRAVHRVRRRQQARPPDNWPLVCAPSSAGIEDWELERLVSDRVVRQLHDVGDGLAWRAFNYDRRYIIALSQNDPPGRFFGKQGVAAERQRIYEARRDRGNFALMHDLTAAVRIADITEFAPGEPPRVDEVKTSQSASTARQLQLAQTALDAVSGSKPLPTKTGTAQTLWRAEGELQTDLSAVPALLERAAVQGFSVTELMHGRVVSCVDMIEATRARDVAAAVGLFDRTENAALERHLRGSRHHLQSSMADMAGRIASVAPLSIYPLTPAQRARMITDLVLVRIFMSAETLVSCLRGVGLDAELVLPEQNGELTESVDLIRVSRADRSLTIHGPHVAQLLLELLSPVRWAEAISSLLNDVHAPRHGVLTFTNERDTWARRPR